MAPDPGRRRGRGVERGGCGQPRGASLLFRGGPRSLSASPPPETPCPDPGRPAPPPPADPAAGQWAILRAPDAHGTAGDEGIRASPSLPPSLPRPLAPGGAGGHLASWLARVSAPSAGVPFPSRKNWMEAAPFPFSTHVLVLGGDHYKPHRTLSRCCVASGLEGWGAGSGWY